ncbi:RNA polymerase sigma factor [Candidatus Roizmanbacteria bacterium]|nr:RNA polymerase sigma factor [Candidatus Roizmanbacteria bacterium]
MSIDEKERLVINNIIHRDEKSLLLVYKKYHKSIFNFVNRKLNDYHLAEEITQDVFLDFIEALRDFHFQCSIKTFLFSIAKNKAIDHIRKKKIKKILFSALPSYFVEGLKTIFIDDEIEKKELTKKIKKTFDLLPNDYQFVLRLKYIEGEKVNSISEKLSIGFKATESLLFRARKAFVKVFQSLP